MSSLLPAGHAWTKFAKFVEEKKEQVFQIEGTVASLTENYGGSLTVSVQADTLKSLPQLDKAVKAASIEGLQVRTPWWRKGMDISNNGNVYLNFKIKKEFQQENWLEPFFQIGRDVFDKEVKVQFQMSTYCNYPEHGKHGFSFAIVAQPELKDAEVAVKDEDEEDPLPGGAPQEYYSGGIGSFNMEDADFGLLSED